MKAAILTLALAIFMLGASATYVKSQGGFSCTGEIKPNSFCTTTAPATGLPWICVLEISLSCG